MATHFRRLRAALTRRAITSYRPAIEQCEPRITPATATLSSGVLSISYTATGASGETVTLTNNGSNITLTGNVTGSLTNPVGSVKQIVVTDSGGSNNQTLTVDGTANYSLANGFSSNDVETVNVNKSIAASSTTATLTINAPKTIVITGGLSASDGWITLNANQNSPMAGNFIGINVNGGSISVGGFGSLNISGRGGDNTSGNQYGVAVQSGGSINGSSTNTFVSVIGTGGASGGSNNYGVLVDLSSKISGGGGVNVTGNGGGSGSFTGNNTGISVAAGGLISGGSTSVNGTGGSKNSIGVDLSGSGAQITGGSGGANVSGNGGGSSAGSNCYGVRINDGQISCSSPAGVTINGSGGGAASGSGSNHGVYINNGTLSGYLVSITGTTSVFTTAGNNGVLISGGTSITSNGTVAVPGKLSINGTGTGNTGAYGVRISSGATVMSKGSKDPVEIIGVGGTSGSSNHGVLVDFSSTITSSGGDVTVTGTAGGSNNTANDNGVVVSDSTISAGGLPGSFGSVTVNGTGGAASASGNIGVDITGSAVITSTGGNVKVNGTGGGTGASATNAGVRVTNGGTITAGGSGIVQVIGKGGTGASGNNNYGVYVFNSNSIITSGGGDVFITGTGGGAGGSGTNYGVYANTSATMSATGVGSLTIVGTAGSATGSNNIGTVVASSSNVSAANGNISVTGIEGGGATPFGLVLQFSSVITLSGTGNIAFIADTNTIDATTVVTAASGSVTLKQRSNSRPINLGGADTVGTALGLTDFELDQVSAVTVNVGDANSGAITVSGAISRTNITKVNLNTLVSINLNQSLDSKGGDIILTSAGSITQTAGTVVAAGGTLTVAATSVTFVTSGNKANSLVIPGGVTCYMNGSFDTTGFVQVGGTLSGSGTVGTVTVLSGGNIAPGNSPGKLSVGNIVFNPGSFLSVELNGGTAGSLYDQLVVNGTVNLGSATLQPSLGFTPTGKVFTIIDNNGTSDAVTSTFNGLAEGATVTIGATPLIVSYKGGDGNDVTLRAAPGVNSVTFGDGTNQRSMVKQIVVNFSESMTFSGPVAGAFTLFRYGTGGTTGNVTLAANPPSGPASTVTITFSGSLTEFGSLVDGLYTFTIDASKVSGINGSLDGNNDGIPGINYSVVGNTANKFFRFFGDSDGSGTVDQSVDFVAFKNAFGFSSTVFDFNNSGIVDQAADYVKFKNNFGISP